MSKPLTHLLSADDITKEDIHSLLTQASLYLRGLKTDKTQFNHVAKGRILASLFFEASTRTRFSFEAAMYRLGGEVISLENGLSSSVKKGESLSDMGRMVSGYSDIIAMRHPQFGSVKEFSTYASVPVINAGDGPHEHPTQSLLDMFTIQFFQNRLEGLSVGFVGDLKYGRTVKSLVTLLALFPKQTFHLISHKTLRLDPEKVHILKNMGHTVIESDDVGNVISQCDVLYMTRIQEERFETKDEYEKVKNHFILSLDLLKGAKKNLSILHPLPRIHEVLPEIDHHPSAHYFKQAELGVVVRMAILSKMLGVSE